MYHSTWNQEYIYDVIDAGAYSQDSQQYVAGKQVLQHLVEIVHDDDATTHQARNSVDKYQRQDRSGIFDHTLCLKETRHRDAKREDTLKVNTTQKGEYHGRMHDARFAFGYLHADERNGGQNESENTVYPCQAKVLNLVASIKSHGGTHHQVRCGAASQY